MLGQSFKANMVKEDQTIFVASIVTYPRISLMSNEGMNGLAQDKIIDLYFLTCGAEHQKF